ncbi:tRNA (N6-isopentenyl adenosine(37)-C2)-methylthiotransferase MiaB [bacterium]|nr:tRNA (N6-isopentenyl adenosine(37)-C2)-methylthiotransferase MiaB [bacterium]
MELRENYQKGARVLIRTYGCQMNKYDSELLMGILVDNGYRLVDCERDADVILVNTCSVREHAEKRALGRLRQFVGMKSNKPGLIVGVYGCMAQRYGDEMLKEVPGIDIVAGPDSFPRILEAVRNAESSAQICTTLGDFDGEGWRPYRKTNSLSGWCAITRGCNNYCSYCIVPYVRGHERSRPLDDIIREVESAVQQGVREITLLGQNVNSYFDGEHDFADLLKAANDIEGLWRIRFATSHPKDFSDKLISAMRELPKVCEHVHLPVQAGSNRILKLMNRGYSREDYLELVDKIKDNVNGVALTTDLLTGFPTENEEDFEQTLDLMKSVKYSGAFTFKYSPRPGTKAAEMENDVPEKTKISRLEQMIKVQQESAAEFSRNLVGTTQEVMFEENSPKNPRNMRGRARNGKIVEVTGEGIKKGDVWTVKINDAQTWVLFGEKIDKLIDNRQ